MIDITPETIDKLERDLLAVFDTLEDLAANSPEKISPELKESYLGFFACLDEFYINQGAHIYNTLKKL